MLRRIIHINKDKCNGCGICAKACHEGAIDIIDGKAHLSREDYCDGLGDCLPACPTNAITFETREAPAYDEAAVKAHLAAKQHSLTGCPGSRLAEFKPAPAKTTAGAAKITSQLRQWPVQIKLLPVNAPYFHKADLLIAADCTAFAYANLHNDFIKDRITLIGCPKLDAVDYSEKLTAIFSQNEINSITVLRMTVPCCGGLSMAVEKAIQQSGKNIPLAINIISPEGEIISH